MEKAAGCEVIAGQEMPPLISGTEAFRAGVNCAGTDKTRTILLVEDEGFVREVACEVLRSAGYRVLTAKNAAEAEIIHERCGEEITLLFTDVVMPGESGRTLAAKLLGRNPRLKVLLATGYGEQMAMSGEECLAKPFSSGELLRRVKCLMDRPAAGNFRKHVCGAASRG